MSGSLQFFARDITEKSSRYLEFGSYQYTDSSKIVFPAGLPVVNQIFFRGTFEFISIKLFGTIAYDYTPTTITKPQLPLQQQNVNEVNSNNFVPASTSSQSDSKEVNDAQTNEVIYSLLPCLSFSAFQANFRDLQCYIFQTKATIKDLIMNSHDDNQLLERFVYLCQCLDVKQKKMKDTVNLKNENNITREANDNEGMKVEEENNDPSNIGKIETRYGSPELCTLTCEQILDEIDSMNIGSVNLTQDQFQMVRIFFFFFFFIEFYCLCFS